jgi:hypothetical protein
MTEPENDEPQSNIVSLFWWKHHRPTKPPPKSTDEKIKEALAKHGSRQGTKQNS